MGRAAYVPVPWSLPVTWAWLLLLAAAVPWHWCRVGVDAALHPGSPCPSIFSYEGTQPERERWYGVVLLSTDEPLVGVRIDLRLDRPAELVVSWMGTVTTDDNERFTILSLDQRLQPGPPIASRFMVKFNPLKGSPQIRTIRLNGRQICPSDSKNIDSPDTHVNNQDHLYENRYTTERVTRRPDLDFDDDWTNSRPATPARAPSSGEQYKPQRPSSGGYGGYDSGSKNTGSGSYNSAEKDPVRPGTPTYNSHESYHGESNHRPSVSDSNTNHSRPDHGGARPLGVDYERPAIIISVNKDVTYNMEHRPESPSYSGGSSSSVVRPSSEREPSYSNTQYQKTTERNYQHNSGGIREETYHIKPTTKKPIVINSININIHNIDDTPADNLSSSYETKPTTRRPSVSNNNRNNSNSNRQTTKKPASRPSGSEYGSSRPNRNPEISSESAYGQNGYNNNERVTTAKTTYGSGEHGSNSYSSNGRPSSSDSIDIDMRPRPVPSSRPSGNDGSKNVQRPSNTGSKYGEEGALEVANANIKCGKVEVNPAPLITHGQNTMRGQWPWHIALYRIDGINLSYSCGGSLISSTLVITAAHCVTKGPRDRPVDADILVVQLGKYHLYQFSDDSVQNKQVRDVYVHPRYNSTNYLDDLAILVLSSPAEFTKYVRPVCLWPRHNFNLPSINDKEGTVVGWGYDENNQVTEELKMARMPVVSYVTCLKSYPQFFSQFTAENKTFCAGFRQGTSVCNGDSGGGMVFQQDGIWYLRGLVSITVAKQGLRVCDTNHYVVFTDIANYIEWIERYMS